MHVVIATDGSRQSLTAAKQFKSFADPEKITEISIVAVIRPLAAVGFASDLSPTTKSKTQKAPGEDPSARQSASDAVDAIAAVFDGWGSKVHKRIRGGSPASEIIKAAKQYGAGLVVIAAGGRGLSDTVLMGSTAQRVQHYAPCPVLVVRPAKKPKGSKRDAVKNAVSRKSTSTKKAAASKSAKKAPAKKATKAPAKKATKKTPAKKTTKKSG